MKKFLCLALALLLLLGLTACGGKEDVDYYVSRTYTRHDTGDVNVLENTYDENWNLLLAEVTLNGNFASKTEYEYSEDLTILTTTSTSAIYEPETAKIIRTFDDKGQLLRAETYSGDRHITTAEYTYDDRGEMILTKSTQPEANTSTTVERIFDDRGNLITYIQDTGFYVSRQEYTYNKKDQRLREETYRDDVLTGYTEYTWEGSTARGKVYGPDGSAQATELVLEYDDAGNLLRQEVRDLSGAVKRLTCTEYRGTDGSVSGSIPE